MDQNIRKKYNYWQWRTLIALMVGYTFYYFLRKNFSAAIPAMEAELGISKVQLGIFLTLNGVVYGVSRLINGLLADRVNKRLMMTAGLVLSSIISFLICFSPKMDGLFNLLDSEGKATLGLVYLIGTLWVINGYVHGMGYPPCSTLMAHWVKPSELATKQGIWNASHSIGAGLVVALCGWLLSRFGYGAWQLCFAVPASLALVGAIALYAALRDTPESVGLPPVEEIERMEAEEDGNADIGMKNLKSSSVELNGKQLSAFINRMVFKNPIIWILSVGNFFVYIIRFLVLEWGTSFLTQYKGLEIGQAASIVAASELIGGVFGTIVAGWFTDKFMKSRAIRTCLICILASTLCLFIFWCTPDDCSWLLSALLLIGSAFFIYGPQALLGISMSQYATKRAAASANGISGAFGYVAPLVSGVGFGAIADNPNLGWNAVFVVAMVCGLAGAALFAFLWNLPANGYEKADKVIAEIIEQDK